MKTLNTLAKTETFWNNISRLESTYYNTGGLLTVTGNRKLGRDTLVLNMGSAKNCPSKALGMCLVTGCCYATKAERLYPGALPYRERQAAFWKSHSAQEINNRFDELLISKKRQGHQLVDSIRFLRINESGDFWGQACVDKAEAVADHLADKYGIITYGYTARADLDYTGLSWLIIRGSGIDERPLGMAGVTKVVEKGEKPGKNWVICPGNCKACNVCKSHLDQNVAFVRHQN